MTPTLPRERRQAISNALARLAEARDASHKPDLERKQRKRLAKAAKLCAYDYETSRIEPGTPRPLYLTAYCPALHFESPIESIEHLHALLTGQFLIDDFMGYKFVAWNGNRFDAYFTAAAMIRDDRFIIRPYLTKSKALRGLKIIRAEDIDADVSRVRGWEFLDGIAMLGLTGTSLEKFLANFAPDYRKLTEVIDFEREEFDPSNPEHRAYAMRDSVGLWHGMDRAQRILLDTFGEPLRVTMGGACIRIFQANIPRDITIFSPPSESEAAIRQYVMRGGFCYCAKRYTGPVWKYDLNQAYAAAMRECALPAGPSRHGNLAPVKGKAAIVRLTATHARNTVPFYYRTMVDGRMRSLFALNEIRDTWVTSDEYWQLKSEGWRISVIECWTWKQTFDMREFVDKLETLRTTCEGGPGGPIGTMVKAVGNHSYGKSIERVEPIEFLLSLECPDGYEPYYGDGFGPLDHVFYRFSDSERAKDYHKPQIGAFITAHVRMVLRRAVLLNPDAWIYADTDCIVFSEDMTGALDIDPKRYGAWKIEESGTVYRFIAKKVYAQVGGGKRSAKGLHVKALSDDDFARWAEGIEPEQEQTQLQGMLAVLCGAEMYRAQIRRGTRVEALQSSAKTDLAGSS